MKHERNNSSMNRSIYLSISSSTSIYWFSNSDSNFVNLSFSKHFLRLMLSLISRFNMFNQKSQHQSFNETASFFLKTGYFHQNKSIGMIIQKSEIRQCTWLFQRQMQLFDKICQSVSVFDNLRVRCSPLVKSTIRQCIWFFQSQVQPSDNIGNPSMHSITKMQPSWHHQKPANVPDRLSVRCSPLAKTHKTRQCIRQPHSQV